MREVELSLGNMPDFAKNFAKKLPKTAGKTAHVVALSGNLGAGKTTFVQAVAKALGVTETVQSPTFIFVRPHPIPQGFFGFGKKSVFKRLVHIDLYRLHPTDADTVGLAAYMRDPENLVMIEWPENMPSDMPKAAEHLSFEVLGPDTRRISHA